MANIKLKEQPKETETPAPEAGTGTRFHARFAKPEPATATERLTPILKRLTFAILSAAAAIAIFLTLPFRQWDHYADWVAIQDTLAKLDTKPDSAADMVRLRNAAATVGISRGLPAGPRPDKWSQRFQRLHYDSAYGLAQMLALDTIRRGDARNGIGELEILTRRTENATVPNIPSTAHLKSILAPTHAACPACKGQGLLALNPSFPLKATLRNTFTRTRKMQPSTTPVFQKCPTCRGSGIQAAPGAQNAQAAAAALPLLSASVSGTLLNIEEGVTLWRPLHTAANMQRAIFGNAAAPHAGTDLFTRLRTASETLLDSPTNGPGAQILADAAKSEDTPPDLRHLAMSAYGISLILRNSPDTYGKVCDIQKNTFAPPYPAPFFTESDYTADCEACQGTGQKSSPCSHCSPPDTARKNAPACDWCKGKKTMLGTCAPCNGKANMFKPSPRVQAAYGDVLTSIIARCDAAALDDAPAQEINLLLPALLLGAALPAALLISLAKRRKRARQFSSLPGMQDIDTGKFTDPLSLGAQESRNNVKRKTARIPIPDEHSQN